jgi:cytochrome c-type biogenesis protein CcmH
MSAVAFWAIAGLLIAGALLFVLPPLLGRGSYAGPSREEINREFYRQRLAELNRDVRTDVLSATQYERARQDLEREFLSEADDHETAAKPSSRTRAPWTALMVGLALPALAAGVYLQFSTGLRVVNGVPEIATRERGQSSIEDMASLLETRLKQTPDDRTGWIMLGRVHTLTGRYSQAAQAYARAERLGAFENPRLLVAFAETLALANEQRLAGRPARLLNKALKLQPENPQALWLAGWAAFQDEQFARAADLWQRLQRSAPAENLQMFEGLSARIADAKRLVRSLNANNATTTKRSGQAAENVEATAHAASLQVSVQLAPELSGRVSPEDTVFVYAQAVGGGRMPLALAHARASQLPLIVTLNDSMAMVPAFKLSSEARVRVTARVSKSGAATPRSGDLVGESPPVSTRGNAPISVTIDQVVR